MHDTVTLVSNKLRAIVPFDTCAIFIVDDRSGKAVAMHVVGDHADLFRYATLECRGRHHRLGDRQFALDVQLSSPELDLVGLPDEISRSFRGVLVSPLDSRRWRFRRDLTVFQGSHILHAPSMFACWNPWPSMRHQR